MLPKKDRLTRQEYWKVMRSGKSVFGQNASVKFIKNNLDHSRYAVVVSSKISKKAVVRNSLRRKLYQVLSKRQNTGLDIVIFPQISMLNLDDAKIGVVLDQVLSKIPSLA